MYRDLSLLDGVFHAPLIFLAGIRMAVGQNVLPTGCTMNDGLVRGRGTANIPQRGLIRRPMPSRGGQLEIAGVVVGQWGANYGQPGRLPQPVQGHSRGRLPPQVRDCREKEHFCSVLDSRLSKSFDSAMFSFCFSSSDNIDRWLEMGLSSWLERPGNSTFSTASQQSHPHRWTRQKNSNEGNSRSSSVFFINFNYSAT